MDPFPRKLEDILSRSYEFSFKYRTAELNYTSVNVSLKEFVLPPASKPYATDYNEIEKAPDFGIMMRFHSHSFESKGIKYLSLFEMPLPAHITTFSGGDDSKALDGLVLPLVLGITKQSFLSMMAGNRINQTYNEMKFINYFTEQKLMLYQMQLEYENHPAVSFEPGREYVVPKSVVLPNGESLCLHMYAEKKNGTEMLSVAGHIMYGTSDDDTNWRYISGKLSELTSKLNMRQRFTGKSRKMRPVLDEGGSKYIIPFIVDPESDDSWRPDA